MTSACPAIASANADVVRGKNSFLKVAYWNYAPMRYQSFAVG